MAANRIILMTCIAIIYHGVNVFVLQEYDHMPPVEFLDDAKVCLGKLSEGRQELKIVWESLSVR